MLGERIGFEGGRKMKKRFYSMVSMMLAAGLVLGGCSGAENPETPTEGENPEAQQQEGKEIKDLVIPKVATRELETFNILYSQLASDFENLFFIFLPPSKPILSPNIKPLNLLV